MLRTSRAESVILVTLLLAWLAGSGLVIVRLAEINSQYPGCLSLQAVNPDCTGYVTTGGVWDKLAGLLQWAGVAFLAVAGIVLGAPLVSREIETGAALISWALASSRSRWLRSSATPLLLVFLALVVPVALTSELLASARVGFEDPGFFELGIRGLVLGARGILAIGIGSLAGALLGRVLPAILLAFLLIGMANIAVMVSIDQLQVSSASVVRAEELVSNPALLNGRSLGQVAVLPDGSVTRERNVDALPAGTDFDWFMIVPSTLVSTWAAVESSLLLATAAASAFGTLAVVRRRKPY